MPLPNFLSSNLQALRTRDATLADLCAGLALDPAWVAEPTPAGAPTLLAALPGKRLFSLHSRIDPLQEARCWADLQPCHDGPLVLLGMGLFYPAREWVRRRPEQRLALVEADPGVLRAALTVVDLSELLTSLRVSLHLLAEVEPVWENIILLEGDLRYGVYAPAAALHPDRYNRLRRRLDAEIAQRRRDSDPETAIGLDCFLKAIAP